MMRQWGQVEQGEAAGHLGVDEETAAPFGQQREQPDTRGGEVAHRAPGPRCAVDGGAAGVGALQEPRHRRREGVVVEVVESGDGDGRQPDLVQPDPSRVPQRRFHRGQMPVGIPDRVDDGVIRRRAGVGTEGVDRDVAHAGRAKTATSTPSRRRRRPRRRGRAGGGRCTRRSRLDRRKRAHQGHPGHRGRRSPGRGVDALGHAVDRRRGAPRDLVPGGLGRQGPLGGEYLGSAGLVGDERGDGPRHGIGVARVECGQGGGGGFAPARSTPTPGLGSPTRPTPGREDRSPRPATASR